MPAGVGRGRKQSQKRVNTSVGHGPDSVHSTANAKKMYPFTQKFTNRPKAFSNIIKPSARGAVEPWFSVASHIFLIRL